MAGIADYFDDHAVSEKFDTRWRPRHPQVSGGHSGLIRKICSSAADGNDWRLPEASGLSVCPEGSEADVGWMSLNKRGRFRLVDQFRDTRGLIEAQANGLNVSCVEKSHDSALEPIAKASQRVLAHHKITADGMVTHKKPKGKFGREAQMVETKHSTAASVRYEICLPPTNPSLVEKLSKDAKRAGNGTKLRYRQRKDFNLADDLEVDMDALSEEDVDYLPEDGDEALKEDKTDRIQSIADYLVKKEKKRDRQRNITNKTTEVEFDKPRLLRLLSQIDDVLQPSTTHIASRSIEPMFQMTPVELNLLTDMLEPSRLAEQFGRKYVECPTVPRRFFIDMSEMAAPEVCRQQNDGSLTKVRVICVFEMNSPSEFDLVDDEGQLVCRCRVWVNGSFTKKLCDSKLELPKQTVIGKSLKSHSVEEVLLDVTKMVSSFSKELFCVLPMAGWGVPTVSKSPMVVRKSTLAHECSVERVDADEIVQLLVAECNKKANIRGVGSSSRSVSPCIETCGICTVASDDLWGLCNCRHLFCANCWRSYLTDRIEMEAITLPCPHFGCDRMVDFDTLRSAVNLPFCDRYADQIGRHFLTNRATEWLKCPEPQCGGLVRFSAIPDREAVVNCHCGATWCSACQNDAHWPATCDQAKVYRQKLEERGDYLPIRDITFGHLTSVKVRSCPHCHVLMEKVEGCDHIVCRCGKSFCYGCGGSSVATHNCTPLASLNPMKKVEFVDVPKTKPTPLGGWYYRCLPHCISLQPRNLAQKARQFWSAGNLSPHLLAVYQQAHSTLEFFKLWLHFSKSDISQSQHLAYLASTLEFFLLRMEDAAESEQADRLASLLPPLLTALKRLISATLAAKRQYQV